MALMSSQGLSGAEYLPTNIPLITWEVALELLRRTFRERRNHGSARPLELRRRPKGSIASMFPVRLPKALGVYALKVRRHSSIGKDITDGATPAQDTLSMRENLKEPDVPLKLQGPRIGAWSNPPVGGKRRKLAKR